MSLTLVFSSKVVNPDGTPSVREEGTLDVPLPLLLEGSFFRNLMEDCGADIDTIPLQPNVRKEFFAFAQRYYSEVPEVPVPVQKEDETDKAFEKRREEYSKLKIKTDVDKENVWIRKCKEDIEKRMPGYYSALEPFFQERWALRKEWLDVARNNAPEIQAWWTDRRAFRTQEIENRYVDEEERKKRLLDLNNTTVEDILKSWIRMRSSLPESKVSTREIELQRRERYNEYLRKCAEFQFRPEDDFMCDCANPLDFSRLLNSMAKLFSVLLYSLDDADKRRFLGEEGISNPFTTEELAGFDGLKP